MFLLFTNNIVLYKENSVHSLLESSDQLFGDIKISVILPVLSAKMHLNALLNTFFSEVTPPPLQLGSEPLSTPLSEMSLLAHYACPLAYKILVTRLVGQLIHDLSVFDEIYCSSRDLYNLNCATMLSKQLPEKILSWGRSANCLLTFGFGFTWYVFILAGSTCLEVSKRNGHFTNRTLTKSKSYYLTDINFQLNIAVSSRCHLSLLNAILLLFAAYMINYEMPMLVSGTYLNKQFNGF